MLTSPDGNELFLCFRSIKLLFKKIIRNHLLCNIIVYLTILKVGINRKFELTYEYLLNSGDIILFIK
jgi:hypothetical protein